MRAIYNIYRCRMGPVRAWAAAIWYSISDRVLSGVEGFWERIVTYYDTYESWAEAASNKQIEHDQRNTRNTDETHTNAQSNIRPTPRSIGNTEDESEEVHLPL